MKCHFKLLVNCPGWVSQWVGVSQAPKVCGLIPSQGTCERQQIDVLSHIDVSISLSVSLSLCLSLPLSPSPTPQINKNISLGEDFFLKVSTFFPDGTKRFPSLFQICAPITLTCCAEIIQASSVPLGSNCLFLSHQDGIGGWGRERDS